jgi:hypothetical protein
MVVQTWPTIAPQTRIEELQRRIQLSNLVSYAESEMDRIGLTNEDEYNGMMREHILKMVKVFAEEHHSGFSGRYALDLLTKLLDFKPLTPLTGEDDEWTDISDYGDSPRYQNKRRSSVFKNPDGECYDIDGKVFWEWYRDENGKAYKSYYSNYGCRLPVTFPYMPPDKPIYEYRWSDAEPRTPPQTEEGFTDEV